MLHFLMPESWKISTIERIQDEFWAGVAKEDVRIKRVFIDNLDQNLVINALPAMDCFTRLQIVSEHAGLFDEFRNFLNHNDQDTQYRDNDQDRDTMKIVAPSCVK